MSKTIEQIKQDLLIALPHFRYAVDQAKKEGTVKLGILTNRPDGTGRVVTSFECDEFFDDIATLIGAPPQTAKDNLTASAHEFVSKHGLRAERGADQS